MTDENAESSAAEATAAEATSAETENTSAEETVEENRVPQSRFSEVVHERNELREAKAALEAKLEAAEVTRAPEPEPELDAQEAEAKRLIEKHAGSFFERKITSELGMTLAQAKTRLEAADAASSTSQQLQWEAVCQKHGLDPGSKDVSAMARGYAASDKTLAIDDVMKKVKSFFPKGDKTTSASSGKAGASVETNGVGETMQSSDWVPRDLSDANAGTRAGKKAKFVSGADAIRRKAAAK